VLAHARDVGQLIGEPGREDDPPGAEPTAAVEGDVEPCGHRTGRGDHAIVDDVDAIRGDLATCDGVELGRREPVVAEVAVHVGGGRVAGLTGVDHDHRPAHAAELEAGREPGGSASDHDDVERAGVVWRRVGHAGAR
jgi:hypothetical protein